MAVDNPLYRCQPDPYTRKFILAMQTLERFEQSVGKLHVKTGPVVLNTEPDRPVLFLTIGW
jgi:hypothetical protein